jgi:hypothetical protein
MYYTERTEAVQPVPSTVESVGSIACPTTLFCVAAGGTSSGWVILTHTT